MKKVSLIDELNRIDFFQCRNIRMGTVLSTDLIFYKEWNDNDYRELKKNFRKIGNFTVSDNDQAAICFVMSNFNILRQDQVKMFDSLTQIVNNRIVIKGKKYHDTEEDRKLWLMGIWLYQMRNIRLSINQKRIIVMHMYSYWCEAQKILEVIQRRKDILRLVAVFDDIWPVDSIIVQKCKEWKIKTSTCMHAIINGSYHYIEYRYSMADYFLAWGNYTRDMALKMKMPKEKIKVLGPLFLLDPIRQPGSGNRGKLFGVLTRGTRGETYMADNISIIHMANKFAREFGYTYVLRIHPLDDKAGIYKRHIDKEVYDYEMEKASSSLKVLDFIEHVEFILCGNTSAFIETFLLNKMAFRFIPEQELKNDVCVGIRYGRISDYKQLKAAFEEYQSENDNDMRKRVLDYVLNMDQVKENYMEFFNEFSGECLSPKGG